MTDTTVNLALPVITAAQAQKHVTHNEALLKLDTLVQLAVLDRDLAAPPASPNVGERWIVADSATGDWAGHENEIAAWQDGAWQFSMPNTGWLAYVIDEGALLAWTGSAWVDAIAAMTSLNNMTLLGVGTTADETNPFSAKLNNILWVAKTVAEGGDGDLRWKTSKEGAANTLSLLFQTAFSGRAEIGLTGDDDFHLKVSPDGAAWHEALTVNRASGGVRVLADESDVASASTSDIGAAPSLKVRITGTATIAAFGTVANAIKFVRFAGALTLTHHAASLILPGSANIATAAGDTCIAQSDASGNWRVLAYQRALSVMDGEAMMFGADALPRRPSTGAIILPRGTTAQRPATPGSTFRVRYNSDTGFAEYWDGSAWVSLPPGYESGSWTPTVTAATVGDLSIVYGSRDAWYIRIGNAVFVRCLLPFTPTYSTASGDIIIDGLPFVLNNFRDIVGNIVTMSGTPPTYPSTRTQLNVTGVASAQAKVGFVALGGGITSTILDITEFTSGALVQTDFAAWYRTT